MEEKYVVYEINEQKVNYNEKPWSFQKPEMKQTKRSLKNFPRVTWRIEVSI